jgi:hypothetical protein
LLHIIGALPSTGSFPRCLNSRQQQRHQDSNNRDHDQQFDQRERVAERRNKSTSRKVPNTCPVWDSSDHVDHPLTGKDVVRNDPALAAATME